ncbi:protein phosphatase regulator [Tilletia horrida]|uniref:Protein phosphatase regulator n=1 Tax=Tilletia horrida TaxID=155126 RepID=A0AAN6GSE3_9BASI|nr:protein phosphatase regulator [Tilletia horrida]KAK0563964.1 protein phosphatase regulator [Tilletia horrida]
MMSAPSPYPVITDTTSPLPDDAQINTVLPSICVDYLSHNWDKDEQIWSSWRAMTKSKNEITNGVRLENASWRTWAKQRGNLKTISPETLNWLKDSDVTWLYGPLHEKANPVPPPKQATFADRLGLESPSATPARPHPSAGIQSDPFISRSSEKRRSLAPVAARTAPAPKSILKHRTIQDMLTLNMGRRAASPAIQPDASAGSLLTPPTPGSAVSVDSEPLIGSSSSPVEHVDGTIASFVRSDTCLPTSVFNSPPIVAQAPGTPTEEATDYLTAVKLTRTASDDASSSSSRKMDAAARRPSLLHPGRASGSSRSALASAEDRGKRPNRHISFNHRVEQCIALDEVTSDPLPSFTNQARSQTPTAFNPSAAMMVPGGSYSSSPSSSSSMRSHLLQQYYGDDDEEDHPHAVEEDTRRTGVSFLAHNNHSSQTVTTNALTGDDEESDRLRFKTSSDLDDEIDTRQRMYTGSASSEEDLSASSSSDGYDSDALTMRSSSVGSVSDSSASHLSSARDSVLGFRSGTVHAGLHPDSNGPHGYRSDSRKGSLNSHHSAAMHTIAKLAPTLLKTSEAYPAPSPAVVDPSNFLQTLEHDREREQLRAQQCIYSGLGRDSDRYSYRHGNSGNQNNTAWAMGDNLFDPAFFPSAHAELYGSSLPVSIPTFGRDGRYGHHDLRYDNYGQYGSSASAASLPSSFDSHRYGPAADDSCLFAGGPSSVPTYHHQQPHLDRASHPHLGSSNAFEEYADVDYDGEYLEDDDIDIDLNLDVDDVDLDLDLDDDDEDEEEYEGQHDSAAYRSYYNRHSSRAKGGGYAGPEGRLRSAHKYTSSGHGRGATTSRNEEEEEADGYERMQTSVESIRPEQASGTAGPSSGARRG